MTATEPAFQAWMGDIQARMEEEFRLGRLIEELEQRLVELLGTLRRQERQGEAPRSHDEPGRCARCGYRSMCDQRL